MMRFPWITTSVLKDAVPALASIDPYVLARVDVDGAQPSPWGFPESSNKTPTHAYLRIGRYDSHLRRQEADLKVFLDDETLVLDPHMDYAVVEGLSNEVRERLGRVRPTSIVRPRPPFCTE